MTTGVCVDDDDDDDDDDGMIADAIPDDVMECDEDENDDDSDNESGFGGPNLPYIDDDDIDDDIDIDIDIDDDHDPRAARLRHSTDMTTATNIVIAKATWKVAMDVDDAPRPPRPRGFDDGLLFAPPSDARVEIVTMMILLPLEAMFVSAGWGERDGDGT
jgi:hypothetical protein